jgi:O-glycosyl hydrolase
MKTTGTRAHGGTLREESLDEYAELWAAYVMGMRRQFEIGIKTISIQNEPDLTFYYPTCGFTPDLYAKAIKAVEARLRKEKLDVRVLGPDTCRIYNMPRYVEAMQKLKVTPGTPILTHLYDLSIPYERVDKDPERWRRARQFSDGVKRPLWLMETANYLSYGARTGSYAEALIWAEKIHHALVEGDCEVVCYWALFFDKLGEALVYCGKSEDRKYVITPKFYTSMNYYRFVRPGMIRCTAACSDGSILVSAFKSRGKGESPRAIVFVNPHRKNRAVLPAADPGGTWKRYVTTESLKCRLEGEVRPGETVLLPSESVTTLFREPPPEGE